MPKEKKIEDYHNWKKSADIANRYGKDGWISTLKNAIDVLLLEEKQKWREKLREKIEKMKHTRIKHHCIPDHNNMAICSCCEIEEVDCEYNQAIDEIINFLKEL